MEADVHVKVAIYQHFAATGRGPSAVHLATHAGVSLDEMRAIFARLRAQRVLALEPDGETIRMAPPFSGVPTQHRVTSGDVHYFANCAWDTLGIAAALRRPATVHSRCEQSLAPLELPVDERGPAPQTDGWLFHCQVPAAQWWHDIVFT